jgi:hypothetical protein
MTTRSTRMPLAAMAAAVLSLMMAACGGGNGNPPPQAGGGEVAATVPVVTITNNVADDTATGDITFTFSFNVDVGTSFTADDITVTGGTKGAFTRVSATSATLVVSPTPNASGTVQVSVAAGGVTDAVGTANAATAASKAFNTVAPVVRTALVTFQEATAPVLTGFGGAEDATVVTDPTDAANQVARVVKSATAELWAGTTVSVCPNSAIARLPFTATLTKLSARVWSPVAGIPVRLKVENAADPAQSVETEATVTVASGWQTLVFDFASPAAGTAALDPARTYDKASIFFDFGTTGAAAGARTYYFDDLSFDGSSFTTACAGAPVATTQTITMDETNAPTLAGFGGAEDATLVADPAGGTNLVARIVKSATAELWAGTTISTAAGNTIARIGFVGGNTTITARVWSPVAGIPVRMKVEDAANAATSVETEATVTTASGWQTLSFNFANPAAGTPALDLAATYNRLSVFFDFGTTGASVGAARTYYIEDIVYPLAAGTGGGGGAGPLVFSTGFAAGNRTVEGGEFGGFSGSNLDGFACNGDPANCGGGGDFTPAQPAANSYFFYYHQTPTPASDLYMGVYVQAPGVTGGLSGTADTAGVQVGGQTQLKFKLGQNAEWFGSATNNFMIVVDLGRRFTVGANTACRLQLRRVVTPTAAAASDYAIPLSSFALVQDCGGAATSVAQALAQSPISQIAFQGVGGGIALSDGTRTSGANLSVANGNGAYPTTVVLVGGITIE